MDLRDPLLRGDFPEVNRAEQGLCQGLVEQLRHGRGRHLADRQDETRQDGQCHGLEAFRRSTRVSRAPLVAIALLPRFCETAGTSSQSPRRARGRTAPIT